MSQTRYSYVPTFCLMITDWFAVFPNYPFISLCIYLPTNFIHLPITSQVSALFCLLTSFSSLTYLPHLPTFPNCLSYLLTISTYLTYLLSLHILPTYRTYFPYVAYLSYLPYLPYLPIMFFELPMMINYHHLSIEYKVH